LAVEAGANAKIDRNANHEPFAGSPSFEARKVPDWTVENLLDGTGGRLVTGGTTAIEGFSIDTRTLKKNEVFFAIKGETHDGHSFIGRAIEAGASAVVASKVPDSEVNISKTTFVQVDDSISALQNLARWHRARHSGKFIGVTGSNGKTTTKEMLFQLFSGKYKTWATSGNLNNHIGLPLNLVRIPLDTEICIMEMGMNHSGEIRFLAGIALPQYALISSIGPAHIGMLGSLENIAHAKGEILENLPPSGKAVLNGDSEFFQLLSKKTKAQVVTFGEGPSNMLRADKIRVFSDKITFEVTYQNETLPLELGLLGKHNVTNAIAALSMFVALGNSLREGVARLAGFKPVSARMETREIDGIRLILDCYNANPASMAEAIEYLGICSGRRIAVLGDMKEQIGRASCRERV